MWSFATGAFSTAAEIRGFLPMLLSKTAILSESEMLRERDAKKSMRPAGTSLPDGLT